MHLDNIVGAFDQYSNPGINRLEKKKVSEKEQKKFLYDVVFRRTPETENSILNKELKKLLRDFNKKGKVLVQNIDGFR